MNHKLWKRLVNRIEQRLSVIDINFELNDITEIERHNGVILVSRYRENRVQINEAAATPKEDRLRIGERRVV